METTLWVFRYLRSSIGREIIFSKNDNLNINWYTNVDWAENLTDKKSTSLYFTFVGGTQ
jgi:hypothetical protein